MSWLKKFHRWIGLIVLLPMLVEGLTGSGMVMLSRVAVWTAPVLQHAVPAGTNAAGVIAVAVQEAAKDGDADDDDDDDGAALHAARYIAADGTRPATVDLNRGNAREAAERLWIDPTTLAVIARKQDPDHWRNLLHRIHQSFLLQPQIGRGIVGWFGWGLVLLIATGLPIWLPPVGRRLTGFRISLRARGARLLREMHGAVAIWLILPLLFQGVSGVTMAFPVATRQILGLPQMRRGGGGGHHHADGAVLDIPAIVDRAQSAVPGTVLTELRLPAAGGEAVTAFLGAVGTPRNAAIMATIAPDGGSVIGKTDPVDSTASTGLAWMRILHSADAGGNIWYLVQFITGLALPLLGITGGSLWLVRRLRKRAVRAASSAYAD